MTCGSMPSLRQQVVNESNRLYTEKLSDTSRLVLM